MGSKSQISIFLIVGIVLIVGVSTFFLISKSQGEPNFPKISDTKKTQESLNYFMGSCLELVSNDAMVSYGIDAEVSEDWIEHYVSRNILGCTKGLPSYIEQGYEVKEGEVTVQANINEETVDVNLQFPIELTKQDATIKFKEQNYVLPRKTFEKIKTSQETLITSSDSNFQIIVPPGTTLSGSDEVGIEVLDREFDDLSNLALMGKLAYRGLPDGAEFSNPVELVINYHQKDVPSTIGEGNLTLGYYNKDLDIWVSLESSEVDEENNVIRARTTHFTPFGVMLRCTEEEDASVLQIDNIITEDCQVCGGWTERPPDPPSEIPGELYIQSSDIDQDVGEGEGDTCEGPTKGTRPVSSCSSCNGDCTGTCDDVGSTSDCDCTEDYFYYDRYEFERYRNDNQVIFADKGDSCIWTREDRDPVIGWTDTDNDISGDEDMVLNAVCTPDSDDWCLIDLSDFQDATQPYDSSAGNLDEPKDACLKFGIEFTFSGFGVNLEESYLLCESEDVGEPAREVPKLCPDCDPWETEMAECIEHTVEYETETITYYIWVPVEDVPPGSNPLGPVRGTNVDCGDSIPTEYPTCPENFEEDFMGKSFTIEKQTDTRTLEWCDYYGDYPCMQYKNGMQFSSDTELLVIGSALNNGDCWILVTTDEYPDGFYMREWQFAESGIDGAGCNPDGTPAQSFGQGTSGSSGSASSSFSGIGNTELCAETDRAKGIDISHHNDAIDWSAVAADRIEFAFMKATEGNDFTDNTFATNWQEAESNGILRGAYHFFLPHVNGRAQAEHFVNVMGSDYGELPPVADVEFYSQASRDAPASQWQENLALFLETVEDRTGIKPMIYTSPGMWGSIGSDEFSEYPLWVAHWETDCPMVPNTWSKWDFWQINSHSSVSGIGGRVDANVFNGNSAELESYAR